MRTEEGESSLGLSSNNQEVGKIKLPKFYVVSWIGKV